MFRLGLLTRLGGVVKSFLSEERVTCLGFVRVWIIVYSGLMPPNKRTLTLTLTLTLTPTTYIHYNTLNHFLARHASLLPAERTPGGTTHARTIALYPGTGTVRPARHPSQIEEMGSNIPTHGTTYIHYNTLNHFLARHASLLPAERTPGGTTHARTVALYPAVRPSRRPSPIDEIGSNNPTHDTKHIHYITCHHFIARDASLLPAQKGARGPHTTPHGRKAWKISVFTHVLVRHQMSRGTMFDKHDYLVT